MRNNRTDGLSLLTAAGGSIEVEAINGSKKKGRTDRAILIPMLRKAGSSICSFNKWDEVMESALAIFIQARA